MAPTEVGPLKADLLLTSFLDEEFPAGTVWRPRAVSDLTDTRLPLKVELPGDAQTCKSGRSRLGSLDSNEGVSLVPVKDDVKDMRHLGHGVLEEDDFFLPGSSSLPVEGISASPEAAAMAQRNAMLYPPGQFGPWPGVGHPYHQPWASHHPLPPSFGLGRQAPPSAPPSVLGHGYWGRRNAAAVEQQRVAREQQEAAAASRATRALIGLSHQLYSEVDPVKMGLAGTSGFNFRHPLLVPLHGLGEDIIDDHSDTDFIKPPPGFESFDDPKNTSPTSFQAEPTTVMLRNIPNSYSQNMLLQLLDEHGFGGFYNFVYLPMDFRNGVNLGYAFVNLTQHTKALDFMHAFEGLASWTVDSGKVCEVSWAHPHQGLVEHVERYRNSPVMHPRMPDEYKPMVFCDGVRVAFPGPTKAIKAPKLRLSRERPQYGVSHEVVNAPGLVAPVA